MSLNTLTIHEAHEGLQKGEFSCTELVESCLSQISSTDEELHAYLTVLEESARQEAKKVDEKQGKKLPLKPLEGIPLALKDNLVMKGVRTTCASKILDTYQGTYDATVVEKLKNAGAVLVGKTNLDEFAMGASTENSGYGPSKNPWDTGRVPGGSSGGSAVAVAADECIAAIGSDTGGSIRQPASLCGVVGFKPTYGMVSRYGLVAMASSLDQIGPFGKTVADATLLFDAIKGPDRRDSSSARASTEPVSPSLKDGIKGMRIGIPKEYFGQGTDEDVEKTIRTAAEVYESLGAQLVDVSLPHEKYALSVYYIIMPSEVSANMARFDGIRYGARSTGAATLLETYTQSRQAGLGPEVRRRIMLGTYALSTGYTDAYYKQAQKVRVMVTRDFHNAFRTCDVILAPTSPTPAFRFGERASDPLQMYLADIFTVSANIVGIPGVSVPCGFVSRDGKDLPVGLQILGKHFDDATVLRAGHAYEQATEWHLRKPPLMNGAQ